MDGDAHSSTTNLYSSAFKAGHGERVVSRFVGARKSCSGSSSGMPIVIEGSRHLDAFYNNSDTDPSI